MIESEFYTNQPEQFVGFSHGSNRGMYEMREHLGLRVDPDIRVFQYKGVSPFELIMARVLGSNEPIEWFVNDCSLRGRFSSKRRSIFVKPGDPFAEIHELSHAIAEAKNPNLIHEYADAWMNRERIQDAIARFALDEGFPQWAAVTVGIKTREPSRVSEAIMEHNKLVAENPSATGLVYDPQILSENIEGIKRSLLDFTNNPVVRKNAVPSWIREIYLQFLESIGRSAMAVGYVYTASFISEHLQYPDNTTNKIVTQMLLHPPSFAELEERVKAVQESFLFIR